MTTGFAHNELVYWHDGGDGGGPLESGFPVQPGWPIQHADTKRRLQNLLELTPLWDQLLHVKARPATEEDVLRFHTKRYVDEVKQLSATRYGGGSGNVLRIGKGSYEVALMAAGLTISAADAVLKGECDNAYALPRPPGHHAIADQGFGACVFANIVVAAKYCQEKFGVKRIAVVDYDVHHGNGTEAAFYESPDVLTISLHQDSVFPANSGRVEDTGSGAGEGYNINIPLPPGSGTGAYDAAFDEIVYPALRRYKPDLIFVASGYDASYYDPSGRMMLGSRDYSRYATGLIDAAKELCGGRIVFSHEGGYSTFHVPFCGLAVMEALTGIDSGVSDPFAGSPNNEPYQGLQAHQEAAVRKARESTGRSWDRW